MAPVRLVLVDDHEMVIEGLKAMLASFSDRVEVVGQAVGAERARGVVDALDPDIVLCDVRMQGLSGLDLCADLRERDPSSNCSRSRPGAVAGCRGGSAAESRQSA